MIVPTTTAIAITGPNTLGKDLRLADDSWLAIKISPQTFKVSKDSNPDRSQSPN
jgi:hypothetical protein